MKKGTAFLNLSASKALIKFCFLSLLALQTFFASAAFARPENDLGNISQSPYFEVNISNKKLTQLLVANVLAEYSLRIDQEGKMLDWPVLGALFKKIGIEPKAQKAVLAKAMAAWTRYLVNLNQSRDFEELAGYTNFSFLESSEFNEQEKEVLRNVFGYDHGKVDFKRGITSAIFEFVQTEALSDPEQRAKETLKIVQMSLLTNGDFPVAAKSILDMLEQLPYPHIQARAKLIASTLKNHRSFKMIQSLLSPDSLMIGAGAFKGLLSLSLTARAGLAGSMAFVQNMSLLAKAGTASVILHGFGFAAYQLSEIGSKGFDAHQAQTQNPDFIYSFLNKEKIDYLARFAQQDPLNFNSTRLAPAIFWGEIAAALDNKTLYLSEELHSKDLSFFLSNSIAFNLNLQKLRKAEVEIWKDLVANKQTTIGPEQILSVASKAQARIPFYSEYQEWSYQTMDTEKPLTGGNCVAKALIGAIYLEDLINKYGDKKYSLKLELFSNHIQTLILNSQTKTYFKIANNQTGKIDTLGTLVSPKALFKSWLSYRKFTSDEIYELNRELLGSRPSTLSFLLSKFSKDSSRNDNPFVKFLPYDDRVYDSSKISEQFDPIEALANFEGKSSVIGINSESMLQAQKLFFNQRISIDNFESDNSSDITKIQFPFQKTESMNTIFIGPKYRIVDTPNLPQHIHYQAEKIMNSSQWPTFLREFRTGARFTGSVEFVNAAANLIQGTELICSLKLNACNQLSEINQDLMQVRDRFLDQLDTALPESIRLEANNGIDGFSNWQTRIKLIFFILMKASGPTVRIMNAEAISLKLKKINFKLIETPQSRKESQNSIHQNDEQTQSAMRRDLKPMLATASSDIQVVLNLNPKDSTKPVDAKERSIEIDREILAVLWTHLYSIASLNVESVVNLKPEVSAGRSILGLPKMDKQTLILASTKYYIPKSELDAFGAMNSLLAVIKYDLAKDRELTATETKKYLDLLIHGTLTRL